MSEMSEKARAAAKSKVERLVRADPNQRVDASGYKPDGAMDADVITGERPVSRRQYRRGGKVAGEKSAARADRKPRASGGALTATSLINRDVKDANKDRGGITHIGGMKTGGRSGRATGGALPYEHPLEQPKVLRSGKSLSAKDNYRVRMSAERRANQPDTGTAYGGWDRDDRKYGGRAHKDMGGLALPNWADKVARATGGRTGKMAGGALTPQQRMGLQQPVRPMMRKAGGKVADHATGCVCAKCGGGRVGKAGGGAAFKRGGPAINDGTRPVAGRMARKAGGRTKKGTNVNIIITQPPAQSPMPPPMARPPAGAPPIGMAQGMPPPGMPAGAPPPGAMAPGAPAPMMPRASGGRTLEKGGGKVRKPNSYPIDAGAGGGRGRLEKAARAARA